MFADIQAAYLLSVPRQYPAGLYGDGTDERKDLDTEAVALSWVAQGGEWIKRRVFPQYDVDGLFLHIFEEAFSIQRAATIALRQAAIISYCRLMLGTATKVTVQRIMAPAFGLDDYTDIDFSFASVASVDAFAHTDEPGRAYALGQIHIHTNGTDAPDMPRALDLIAKWKPTWLRITAGKYQQTIWGTQGNWGEACW